MQNQLGVSLAIAAFAYLYGVLSPAHYRMFGNDFNSSLVLTTLFGLSVCFGLRAVVIKHIGFATLTWLALAMIIIIQPVVNHIDYPDALMFPFGLLVLTALFSIIATNTPVDKRGNIIQCLAWLFWVVGILSTLTQFAQLFYPNTFGFIAKLSPLNRLYANLSQPNQASFVNVLAVTSGFYLFYLHLKNKKVILLLAIGLMMLVMGISFSLSRAGLLLLMAAIFGAVFYPWPSHKLRIGWLAITTTLSVVGYHAAILLMQSFSTVYQGTSGVDRLLSEGVNLRHILLERAWSAFSSNPVFGVGYDNYLSYGFANIERWDWFEPADHAHNVIAQIGAEFGIVGLIAILGVVFVLFKQLVLFFRKKLSPHALFLCLMLFIFVLYSFSEFPLWYPKFLFSFAFMIGLLDRGFLVKNIQLNRLVFIIAVIFTTISGVYAYLYHHYLIKYEITMFANVDNQQKIDAYYQFPNIFGFYKSKEYMLHMIVDENTNNTKKLIELGWRVIHSNGSMDVTRVQVRLLMKEGRQEEADALYRRLCIWEYQQSKNCDSTLEKILEIDSEDGMSYAKRLNDWYAQRYGKINAS